MNSLRIWVFKSVYIRRPWLYCFEFNVCCIDVNKDWRYSDLRWLNLTFCERCGKTGKSCLRETKDDRFYGVGQIRVTLKNRKTDLVEELIMIRYKWALAIW